MIIFDDGLGHFGSMTDLRASFELRTGMYTTAGRAIIMRPKSLAGYWVPPRLEAILRERANAPVNELPQEEEVLCVNGRWAMPDFDMNLDLGSALVEKAPGGTAHVVMALLRRADAEYFLTTGELHERAHTTEVAQRVLYRYPWDVIAQLKQTIPADIFATRLPDAKVPGEHVAVIGDYPVEISASASIGPYVTFDASVGPILVCDHAVIRPGAVLCGPCSIGPHSTIIDRALIKSHTAIGPWCKVAGEVGGTIFQGYSNKAHDGHLGDSWVGKWVNFGAGTTNSNLLNTYTEVMMRVDAEGPRHRTGLTFLGAIVGDHAKFAINTRLMTGTMIGTGAMIATSTPPPTAVRRFSWLTDDGQRNYKLDKFLDVMKAVMARRHEAPSESYINAISEVHSRFTTRSAVV